MEENNAVKIWGPSSKYTGHETITFHAPPTAPQPKGTTNVTHHHTQDRPRPHTHLTHRTNSPSNTTHSTPQRTRSQPPRPQTQPTTPTQPTHSNGGPQRHNQIHNKATQLNTQSPHTQRYTYYSIPHNTNALLHKE